MFRLVLAATAHAQTTEISCPATFELIGKSCVKTVVEPAQAICKSGVYVNGKCSTTSAPLVKCKNGIVVDGECHQRQKMDKVKVHCPAGFVDNGVAYVREYDLETVPYCDVGVYDGVDKCVEEVEVPSKMKQYCADGASLDSKGCKATIQLSTVPVCEAGNFVGGQCVQETYKVAELVPGTCPEGFEEAGDMCTKEEPAESTLGCADGSELVDAMCLSPVQAIPLFKSSCLEGFEEVEGGCQKKSEGELTDVCPLGSVDADGECKVKATALPLITYACPEGFEEVAGKDMCYKTEEYDCSAALETGKTHGALRGEPSIREISKMCEKKTAAPKIETVDCPEEFERGVVDCLKFDVVEKLQKCSLLDGSVEDCSSTEYAQLLTKATCEDEEHVVDEVSSMCLGTAEVDPVEVCETTGKAMDDTCVIKSVASKMYSTVCDHAASLVDGRCLHQIKTDPKIVCEDQRLPAEACFDVSYSAPVEKVSCVQGAVFEDGKCILKRTHVPVVKCENGKAFGDCVETEVVDYSYQCPHFNGIEEIGGECYKINVAPLDLSCDFGVIENGACVMLQDSVKMCGEGLALVNGNCYGKEYAEPVYTYTKSCTGKGCETQ